MALGEELVGARFARAQLESLRERMLAYAGEHEELIARAARGRGDSVRNLIHYIALREHNLRPLQKHLASLGLSSLGRAEPCVLANVEAVMHAASRLPDPALEPVQPTPGAMPLKIGWATLAAQADALLGPRPAGRAVRIMVTMPSEAAQEPGFVEECVGHGMNVMRINTAHDDADAWVRMVRNARAVERRLGRRCRVFADLAGPKLRTSRLASDGVEAPALRFEAGDIVTLRLDDEPIEGEIGPSVWCSEPEALAGLQRGHAVWFDDGKIGACVEDIDERGARLRVTFTKPGGQKLRPEKGLNLPDTQVALPSLTAQDREALKLLAPHVDGFSLSFVRRGRDVRDMRDALRSASDRTIGVVLKVETREGFSHLPELLFELLTMPVGGVMIARGDLAVECGFERLAEIQEEILWFSEAAHTPVIWATEVLDSLAKQGRPTRAEITDAAMAQRAECVMLNKGPEILRALSTLSDILVRMEPHQRKKMAMFRPLRIASFPDEAEDIDALLSPPSLRAVAPAPPGSEAPAAPS